ncbi:MAG: hypothetical protein ISR58_15810 [Anaerolineales bacterium]|nr:hypothetical protein [Chloroflexota bacterium]MBL6982639.1 hypothetical protein [Anaerolineales bacterium]
MKNLKILVLLSLILALSACSSRNRSQPAAPDAKPDSLPDLVGKYAVNGFDPLGTEYGGHLTIFAGNSPGEYQMQWILVGSIQEGIGILKGNQLIVEWHSVEGMLETQGNAVYTVTEVGELYGMKTVDGLKSEGAEIAFPNE